MVAGPVDQGPWGGRSSETFEVRKRCSDETSIARRRWMKDMKRQEMNNEWWRMKRWGDERMKRSERGGIFWYPIIRVMMTFAPRWEGTIKKGRHVGHVADNTEPHPILYIHWFTTAHTRQRLWPIRPDRIGLHLDYIYRYTLRWCAFTFCALRCSYYWGILSKFTSRSRFLNARRSTLWGAFLKIEMYYFSKLKEAYFENLKVFFSHAIRNLKPCCWCEYIHHEFWEDTAWNQTPEIERVGWWDFL